MIEITQNVIIGTIIIIINAIPLITKKYKYLLLTAAISVLLALINIYLK